MNNSSCLRLTLKWMSLYFTVMLIACAPLTLNDKVTDEVSVVRLNNSQPIISQRTFDDVGVPSDAHSINGPSVIRIPDWVKTVNRASPKAIYYLYFGDHKGKYIRLAWAINIEGPWTLFNVGTNNDSRVNGSGVFDLGSTLSAEFSGGAQENNHISSP